MEQPERITRRNIVVLANAVELASLAISKTLGNDTAKAINGIKITREMIADGTAVYVNGHLNIKLGA
jgi:hypothetical protein